MRYGNITYEADVTGTYRGEYAWTGRQLDVETGLQCNNARWYDSTTGNLDHAGSAGLCGWG